MQPIKIGFDAKRLFLNNTGLGNYSRNLLNALSTHHPENEYALFTPMAHQKHKTFIDKFPVYTPKGIWEYLPHQLWRSFGIKNLLKEQNIDIYHGLSHELPFGIEKSKCKSVVTMHDVIFKLYPEHYKATDRIFYDKKIKNALKSADKIICISNQTLNDISSFYEVDSGKIEVIYQSCSPNYEAFKVENDRITELKKKYNLPQNFMLSVGMNQRKNLDVLLDAIALLKERKLDFPALVLVGNKNAYQMRLKEKVISNRIEKDVFFLENVNDDELPHLYHMALFSTFLSVYEGFGIPLVESLMCKTPVITNKSGCFPEAAGPGALYTSVHSKEKIADAILQLSQDNLQRQELVEKGFNYVQKFNAKEIANQWNALYKKLL